jgi:hypothetical protein
MAGSAVVMLSASKEYICDPAMAEGSGWRAVELACSLDLENIMLEGDSIEVVQALKKNAWEFFTHRGCDPPLTSDPTYGSFST